MKMLCFHTPIIDDDATVGEHTVHIEEQQAYLSRLFAQRGGNTLHRTVKSPF
jgi:hypothetical protein